MPPKRAAATGATAPSASKQTTTRRAAAAPKATASKPAAPKKTAAPKKAAPAKEATPKKTAATKKAAAPNKPTAASRKKAVKNADESDKENEADRAKVNGTKRKRDAGVEEPVDQEAEGDVETETERVSKRAKKADTTAEPAKKRKAAAPAAKAAPKRVARQLKVINEAPTQVMDIFVFGEGTAGELGLGSVRVDGKKPIDVKRPRINHNLKNVVQVACGGMHVAALTKDNKILTWGVNDQGALGRDTTWDGGLRDVADDNSSDGEDDDDTGMNPNESTPAEIDTSNIPEGTKWVQLVASDSATFALTETGQVYGWGTFRVRLLFRRCLALLLIPAYRVTRAFSASTGL